LTTTLNTTLFPYTTLFRSETRKYYVRPGHAQREAARFRNRAGRRAAAGRAADQDGIFRRDIAVRCAGSIVGRAGGRPTMLPAQRSEEHTSELQSRENLVCR